MTSEPGAGPAPVERALPDDRRVRISAVIACYRDAPAVPIMHERLARTFAQLDVEYEIIFVNDGSPDDARAVLAELAARDPSVVVINHTRPFGSQSAFTSGMRVATGDAVALLDGDLQDPPELLTEFYERWRQGYDVVYGQRMQRVASRPMQVAYKGFYRLFRQVAYVTIPLDAGDFSLMDRRVVDTLNRLPESQRFMRGLRAWVGFRSVGVPYTRPERMFGTTTNSMVKNLAWAQRGIVSFSYVPLQLILLFALASVGVAVVAGIAQLALKLADPSSAPSGFATVILLILMVGGLILLSLSVIGFYIADIYAEVKARPPFVVDEILNDPARPPDGPSGSGSPDG